MRQLYDFLRDAQNEGRLDSEGAFGISREEALRKVASLGLPFEYAWALKLVQAAVEAGARRAEFKLGKDRITVTFPGKHEWDLEHLEQAFFLQENSRDLVHDHLLRALWSLHKSFRFQLRFGLRRLDWDGKKMSYECSPEGQEGSLRLVVESGGSLASFLRYFSSARLNAGVSKVLQDWAFAAPIPVRVDGRKINTLHACPTHRVGEKKQTLVAVFLQSAEPRLSLPWQEENWSPISRQIGVETVNEIGCCALLTVGSKLSGSELIDFRWRQPPGSLFYWVQSGVVIQSERLPSRGVGLSWAVLLSADGLQTDLTSFSLLESSQLDSRKRAVMLSLLDNLKSYRLRHEEFFKISPMSGEQLEREVADQVKAQAQEWNAEFRLGFDISGFRRHSPS